MNLTVIVRTFSRIQHGSAGFQLHRRLVLRKQLMMMMMMISNDFISHDFVSHLFHSWTHKNHTMPQWSFISFAIDLLMKMRSCWYLEMTKLLFQQMQTCAVFSDCFVPWCNLCLIAFALPLCSLSNLSTNWWNGVSCLCRLCWSLSKVSERQI